MKIAIGVAIGAGGKVPISDVTAPTVVITCVQSSPTSTTPLNFIATFSEEVTGFVAGDPTIGGVGGAVANFASADNIVYTFDSAPSGAGAVTVDIGAGVCEDLAGNPNTAAVQKSITYTPSYSTILIDTYGANEVWPLVDIASGTVITAKVASARNGVLTGWDLQNAAGPVTGTLAPYSDKVNDFGNIYTSDGSDGLVDIFDGAVLSVFAWFKNDVDWTGNQTLLELRVNTDNRLTFAAANGTMFYYYSAGGTAKFVSNSVTGVTGWHSFGLSVDKGADQVKGLFDGVKVQNTQTGLGVWAGNLINTASCIGAETTGPTKVVKGWPAYFTFKFGSIWSEAEFAAMHAAAATSVGD